jgi:hypothetical protein
MHLYLVVLLGVKKFLPASHHLFQRLHELFIRATARMICGAPKAKEWSNEIVVTTMSYKHGLAVETTLYNRGFQVAFRDGGIKRNSDSLRPMKAKTLASALLKKCSYLSHKHQALRHDAQVLLLGVL